MGTAKLLSPRSALPAAASFLAIAGTTAAGVGQVPASLLAVVCVTTLLLVDISLLGLLALVFSVFPHLRQRLIRIIRNDLSSPQTSTKATNPPIHRGTVHLTAPDVDGQRVDSATLASGT